MDTLFPVASKFPEGFEYFPNFITPIEESHLITAIEKTELHNFNFQGYIAKRKVASFGYDYNFEKNTLSKREEIPLHFNFLINKISNFLNLKPSDFGELLVTEYPIGSVINWHRDAFPFDIIVGISLLSDCTFKLRPYDKEKQIKGSIRSLAVKRRSIYLMKGDSRTNWQHSISPVKEMRYSITLRTLRKM